MGTCLRNLRSLCGGGIKVGRDALTDRASTREMTLQIGPFVRRCPYASRTGPYGDMSLQIGLKREMSLDTDP